MKPTDFNESNKIYTAPRSMPDCGDLPVFQNSEQIISCWEMTDEEKLQLILSNTIWLGVCGQGQPPVWISPVSPFAEDGNDDERAELERRLESLIETAVREFIEARFVPQDLASIVYFDDVSMPELLTEFLRFVYKLDILDKKE